MKGPSQRQALEEAWLDFNPDPSELPSFTTVPDLVEYTGVPQSTVRKWLKAWEREGLVYAKKKWWSPTRKKWLKAWTPTVRLLAQLRQGEQAILRRR